ncbi:MAG: glutathione-regulated potassium-efflux system protein KefC [Alphaproteobacteria bacterium]|nr:MAG: glutathione-regulated potassium-efflux system protein KefC [Alphaproteobacteria bacterium]
MLDSPDFLHSTLIYLCAALVTVPLFQRLGLGSVLGYLVAGMAIGPWGLALITDVPTILNFSEFGVVLLMFLIGLELNPSKLWQLRRPMLGLGTIQVAGTTIILAAIGTIVGLGWTDALLAALALALSSTPIALQTIEDKKQLGSPLGQTSFAILLFQDIAVVPVLALVPLLAPGSEGGTGDGFAAIRIVAVFAAFILGGRYLLRPIFRVIALTHLREVFTAFSLFLVIGTALLMQEVGLSMALGAFLAGVLLAESEYRHELELNIEPFKGLLLGLFFIAVGMSVNFSLLISSPFLVAAMVLGLLAVKMAVLFFLGWRNGWPWCESSLFAIVLSQGGEFAFVLISAAQATGYLTGTLGALLVVVATLSMLATPLMIFLYDRVLMPRFRAGAARESDVESNENHVIIAGYGRFGQIVGRLLMSLKIPITVLDHDPNHIEFLRKFGFKLYYGDAGRLDLLEAAGAAKARLLVLAIDNQETLLHTAKLVRQHYPSLTILARARNRGAAQDLLEHGITLVRRETFGSALEIGELALRELGFSAHQAHKTARKFRDYDEHVLKTAVPLRKDEKAAIDYAKRSRQELERLMSAELATDRDNNDDWQ